MGTSIYEKVDGKIVETVDFDKPESVVKDAKELDAIEKEIQSVIDDCDKNIKLADDQKVTYTAKKEAYQEKLKAVKAL